ncbi:MAG: DUF4303 domain-containing protein [Burkholderiales bacterium]|jgi:hypothetical protein|nr:DUF4303 domain-containing protein [Burkholderiales bacterium]
MNWDGLTKGIIAATRAAFSDLLAQHKEEHFYAFALYTDSDCWRVVPAANSIEKYNEKISNNGEGDASEQNFYKWYSGEWAYEAWGGDRFNGICGKLSAACTGLEEEFYAFKEHVHLCMNDALLSLDKAGFWGASRSGLCFS